MGKQRVLRPREEADCLILVGLAVGLTQEAIGEQIGIARQHVNRHISENKEWFDLMTPMARTMAAQRLASEVEKVTAPIDERVKSMFDRSFRISERALDKAEEEGDAITLETVMAIHESFTKWAAKHLISDAPKRVALEGSIQHEHRLVPTSLIASIEAVMREQKALPAADIIDAEVVQ